MIKVFACFLLGCVVLTFGARRERIGFGRDVTELELKEKFPFMVYVDVCTAFTYGTDCNLCSGTLVKPDRVIVAAHCYCGKGSNPTTTVWSNTLKRGSPKGTATAGWHITSGMPKYNCEDLANYTQKDIALIGLIRKLNVKPVPLFCGRIPIGENVTLLGFGYNEKKVNGPLRVGTGNTNQCPLRYKDQHCVYSIAGKSTIFLGDSGGPLLIKRGGKFIQIGVASAGTRHIPPTTPVWNVWSDVRPHCLGFENTKSAGQRSAIGTTELVIQSFVLFFILNF